ncbi:MAG: HAD family phosphatase [Candidatus Marinimicrobia bacterium]|nr:HAD family phosphatase [Candidatus Neomarinimicrobiota bacterium]
MNRSPNSISTIFFDIGGVLLKINLLPLMTELTRLTGQSIPDLKRDRDYALYCRLERGEISIREYHDRAFRTPSGELLMTFDRFIEFWRGILKENTGVHKLLPVLRRQARVWLLSNTNDGHLPHLEKRNGFFQAVDGLIASHLVGLRKPEPAIYRLAMQKAGARPEESLFIDDVKENVEAAQKLGIRSHQFVDQAGLEIFLKENGLLLN